MKKILITTFVLMQFLAIAIYPQQQRKTQSLPNAPRKSADGKSSINRLLDFQKAKDVTDCFDNK